MPATSALDAMSGQFVTSAQTVSEATPIVQSATTKPQISPLRIAPVLLTTDEVAGRGPFSPTSRKKRAICGASDPLLRHPRVVCSRDGGEDVEDECRLRSFGGHPLRISSHKHRVIK